MTAFWKYRKRRREAAAALREARRVSLCTQLGALAEQAADVSGEAAEEIADALEANAAEVARVTEETTPQEHGPWTVDSWASWSPDTTTTIPELRVGTLRDEETGADTTVPIVVPLDTGAPLVLLSRTAPEHAAATELLASLAVRATACHPKQARLALLDPHRHGATFPMSRRFERVLLGFGDTQHVLDEVLGDVLRFRSSYLDRRHRTFDDVPLAVRLAESRQFVIAACYPHGYEASAADTIEQLAAQGPASGVHTVVHIQADTTEGERLALRLAGLGATVVDLGGTAVELDVLSGELIPDSSPPGSVLELVFQRIAAAPRRDAPIPWADLQDLAAHEWWSESAEEVVAAPIGRAAADQACDLWLGADADLGRSCDHGIVVAADAAERRNLYDSLLAGLTIRYRPGDLCLHLVEGDDPLFAAWGRAPHTELVALRPSPDQARHVLRGLRIEAERRAVELSRHGIERWSARPGGAGEGAQRILAVFDGYERLFLDDPNDEASDDLRRVLDAGPSAGIHVVLGGSRFDQAGPLHRAGLFDRLGLRIAAQLAADDALGRDEFGVHGVGLVQRVCDRPRRAVANTMHGHDDGNVAMQLATIGEAERDRLIGEIAATARRLGITPLTNRVLNGAAHPQLLDNPHLVRLAGRTDLRSAPAIGELARMSPALGGLGIDDWIDDDHPRLLFLGQSEEPGAQAHLVVRRRPTENIAVVIGDRALRTGAVAAMVTSTMITGRPDDVELWVADRSSTHGPGGEIVEQLVRRTSTLGVPCHFTRDAAETVHFIEAVGAEVGRRRELADADVGRLPSVLVVIVEPERVAPLGRVPTAAGVTDSPAGLDMRYVLMQGPAVGVHVILVTSSAPALRTVLADTVVHQEFRHRVVTRLAEEDSFALVRSGRGAALVEGDGRAATALMFDSHTQRATTFVPYTAGSADDRRGSLDVQAATLLEQIMEHA